MFIKIIQHFGIETEVAQHLADSYGDRAWAVASMASETGKRWPVFGKRISNGYPYIEAEVRYAVRNEYACTAVVSLYRIYFYPLFLYISCRTCLLEELAWQC